MISRVILLVIGLWLTTCANAALWKNLWFTPDQQGWQALKDKHPKKAAEQFTNKLWKGVALYRSGQYKQAVKFFAGFNTPLANYNRGNALAHLGDYKAAIDAYDLAIKQKPDFKDAIFNRDVLKKLMHQQKPQPQQKKSMENNQATTKNKQTKTQMSKTQSAKKKSASRNINNKNQQEANSSKSKEVSQAKSNPANEKNTTNTDKQEKAKNLVKNNSKNQHETNKQLVASQSAREKSTVDDHQSTIKKQKQNHSKQQLQQWLQQIPDDPGGLLKQKFLRDHLRLQNEKQNENF